MNMDKNDNETMSSALVLANRTAVLLVPEHTIYRHLTEKAQELGIDPSETSLQSRIFHDLLQNIRALEELRQYLSRVLNGEPYVPAKASLPRDFVHLGESTGPQPTVDPAFDLKYYDDSPQASFYSRLLDTRVKLQHEIEALHYLQKRDQAETNYQSQTNSQPASDDDEHQHPRIRVRSRERERKEYVRPGVRERVFYDTNHKDKELPGD